jgi:nitroreductase
VLIDDKNLLERIGSSTAEAAAIGRAPLAIAVCVDVAHYEGTYKVTDGTWMEDCSCVMMNVLTAARALGLEGFWFQVLNRPEKAGKISPLLGIPDGVKLFAIATVGYPNESSPPHEGIDEARFHKNGW